MIRLKLLLSISLLCSAKFSLAQDIIQNQQDQKQTSFAKGKCNIAIWVPQNYQADVGLRAGVLLMATGGALGGIAGAVVDQKLKEGSAESETNKIQKLADLIPPNTLSDIYKKSNINSKFPENSIILQANYFPFDYENSQFMVKSKTRLSDISSECYYEIFIKSVLITDKPEKNIKMSFEVRSFTGNNLKRKRSANIAQRISYFPGQKFALSPPNYKRINISDGDIIENIESAIIKSFNELNSLHLR